MSSLEIVMWEHTDGSIHAEMRLATFKPQDDTGAAFVTHLAGDMGHGACGAIYRYRGPHSLGLGRVGAVDCAACRDLIRGTRFVPKEAPKAYFTIEHEPDDPDLFVVYARGERRGQFETMEEANAYVVEHGGEFA